MVNAARKRAKDLGLEFSISADDIEVPAECPVLGIPIEIAVGGGPSDGSPSLDRIDSTRGYVRGNVAVISFLANRIKSNGTAEQHEKIAAWMRAIERKAQS